MVEILLSLKPKWWAKIASGEKTVEIRKTIPRKDSTFKVYVYETKEGQGAIVGEFTVNEFIENYANSDGGKSCLSDGDIYAYGQGDAFGWCISEVIKYAVPSVLQEFGLDRAPQSWQYLKGSDA